jgi:hypothetical protein
MPFLQREKVTSFPADCYAVLFFINARTHTRGADITRLVITNQIFQMSQSKVFPYETLFRVIRFPISTVEQ